jgi:hypothetical protein
MCRVHAQNRHMSAFGTRASAGRGRRPPVRGGPCAPPDAWRGRQTSLKVVDKVENISRFEEAIALARPHRIKDTRVDQLLDRQAGGLVHGAG